VEDGLTRRNLDVKRLAIHDLNCDASFIACPNETDGSFARF
jgi:hypothetical protein